MANRRERRLLQQPAPQEIDALEFRRTRLVKQVHREHGVASTVRGAPVLIALWCAVFAKGERPAGWSVPSGVEYEVDENHWLVNDGVYLWAIGTPSVSLSACSNVRTSARGAVGARVRLTAEIASLVAGLDNTSAHW